VQAQGTRPRPIAVRQPASPMEELAWNRLNADVIRLHPNEFATRVLGSLSPGKEALPHV
jgi:hypothetical protein